MKNRLSFLVFLITMLISANFINAQKIDSKNFVGHWSSESTTTRLVFFMDIHNKLQLVEWATDNGEEMEITNLSIADNKIKTTERFKSTDYETTNEYILEDENTLKNIISGDANSTIYFKRLK